MLFFSKTNIFCWAFDLLQSFSKQGFLTVKLFSQDLHLRIWSATSTLFKTISSLTFFLRLKFIVKYSFRYGRLEVVAKTPEGRGLWPAIWLLPTENIYGTWPGSGEVDIFEGRGQKPTEMQSNIHFGTFPCCDGHMYNGSPRFSADCKHTASMYFHTMQKLIQQSAQR